MEIERLNPRFVAAVLRWIENTAENREVKEADLRSFIKDAGLVTKRSYSRLYRGQPISGEQMRMLKEGDPILIDTCGLRSWTTKRQVALEWAETGGFYPAICIEKAGMKGFLDIKAFVARCKGIRLPEGDWEDALRYGYREGEVIVDHAEPLVVTPDEVLAFCGDEYEDGPIAMKML